VFECVRDKCLGPHGFSLTVFQGCWDLVMGDLEGFSFFLMGLL
jgi:hypothetical protein